MVQRIGGSRRKTRDKLSKHPRQRGKISIRRSLQQFENGEHVTLSAEPAVQHGMYHPRFHGKAGTVVGTQGACFQVRIKDHDKPKVLIVHPIHLKRQ